MMGALGSKERKKVEVEALLNSAGFRLARLHQVQARF